MLGQALALTLLLLLQGHRGQGSAERVVGLSGQQLFLEPLGVPTKHINSAQWKVKWYLASEFSVILTWKNGSDVNYVPQTTNHFDSTLSFTTQNLALLIKAVWPNHSGCYNLEVTDENGKVDNHYFQVSIFDHIEMPQILKEWRVLEGDTCQLFLSCLVSSSGNVSYAWYRGSELIQTEMNLTRSEEQVVNDSYIYTCNVSNPVSSANHTLRLTQGCPTASKQDNFVYLLVIIGICLLILFLVTLTCFCVWRRKKRQSAACPGEPLTVYEDVNHVQMGRNQEQNQNPPGEGSTIYSMIQSQSSAPTSQENNTLYALVQPSRKSESKKNQSSSFSHTIYEEVGKRQLKAQNPARLSRKELENFCIYS